MNVKELELAPELLRSVCDPKTLGFRTTAEVKPLDGVIGQERAVQAIEFGLAMKRPGYNIFVTGQEGTGKTTIVRPIVSEAAKRMPTPMDWVMVNNFQDEYCPRALALAPGKANGFSRKMHRVIEELRKAIPRAFSDERFQKAKSGLKKKYAQRQTRVFSKVERLASEKNIQIVRTETGFEAVFVHDGKPLPRETFARLSRKQQKAIEENIRSVELELESAAREVNRISGALREEIEKLVDGTTRALLQHHMGSLKNEFKELAPVTDYLDEVQQDIVDNVQNFLSPEGRSEAGEEVGSGMLESSMKKYQINVLVDRGGTKGAPVIFESNPTYTNLFGQIEKRAVMGAVTTDFTMVQAGSLLKANGGFLIMEVEPLLMTNYAWEALKRALQNKSLALEDMASEMGFVTASLRPEPIPLDVKVILLGGYWPFQALQDHDPKFNKIFRVRADFDYEVKRTEETQAQYARYISRICRQEHLLPFTAKAVAAIIEFGNKAVSDKERLSIRFGPIMGLILEADHWTRKRNGRRVTDKDVVTAFKEHRFRYNLYEEKIQESYLDGTLMIDVEGKVVGQVNALAVYQIGDLAFGRPSRITAETFMGKAGMINIEREAKLSGKTHDKGVLILSGYLGRTFARNEPLSLSISLTFEQSYGEIDGDSASSTELYAILSSLADIPIQQGIAVTGSVDQKGRVQAIGGVNYKIEGFFDVCQARGLTGRQGVIIPRANVKNLMLRREVVDAVREKRFHIYQVSRVEEGIEILTGVPAGEADELGNYPIDSIYGRAQSKLRHFLERAIRIRKEMDAKGDPDL